LVRRFHAVLFCHERGESMKKSQRRQPKKLKARKGNRRPNPRGMYHLTDEQLSQVIGDKLINDMFGMLGLALWFASPRLRATLVKTALATLDSINNPPGSLTPQPATESGTQTKGDHL
jgi:hypothetical protein